MADGEAVVVGVRVRPFNDRETNLKATLCIDMQGPTTVITGPSGVPQSFNFDQSFWSHDGFVEEEGGYCAPDASGRYADQRYVFETFGKRVLDNAWKGYHCCLFAYGQTGAGKSYSMVGYGANKGIVPISCEEIFKRVNNNTDSAKRYEIQVSMVEIYNETVQDLFIPFDQRPKNGFQIRESKSLGIYVDGIVKNAVDSYAAIERAIDQGTANRSIGSTQMNATSSRAHTVITIEFKQIEKVSTIENVKISNINLIDLAGSEKAGQTGATGDRLKEGSAINKSLSALGNVIEKLAEKSQAKGKKDTVVPYRDSKLTRLLQNALGGSSKTIMICALSPASSNYEETLSTLRYADRAKKIKNAAVVNENPQEKILRELREENAKLKAMAEATMSGTVAVVSDEEKKEQEEKIEQLQVALDEAQKSFQQKIEEARKRDEDYQSRQTLRAGNVGFGNPMIVNLNAEMQLTGKLRFEFPEGKTILIGGTLGSCKAGEGGTESADESGSDKESNSDDTSTDSDSDDEEDRPSILLSSPGVSAKHARVDNVGRRCLLTCLPEAGRATWINGVCFNDLLEDRKSAKAKQEPLYDEDEDDFDMPEDAVLLRHCDRLVMGRAIFLFVDPQQGIAEMLIMSGLVSYAKARKELPATWKGSVTEAGKDANRFQTMIRNAVARGMAQAAEADQEAEQVEGEGTVRRSVKAWTGLSGLISSAQMSPTRKSLPTSRQLSLRSSTGCLAPMSEDGSEESEGESSLGDGATKDEVLITQLKETVAARDRESAALRRERDEALQRAAVAETTVARLTRELEELAPGRARPRGTLTSTRAVFADKVAALDQTFREALAALDTTRQGLTVAVNEFDASNSRPAWPADRGVLRLSSREA